VTAVDGAGDTLVATATTAGTAGNALASTETMANASWGASTFAGGLDAEPSEIEFDVTDATAETITLRVGPADVGSLAADYTETLQLTHTA
jgi:bifunctional ADP-heptose synthase (sugar kinase/adenylyltransferase)